MTIGVSHGQFDVVVAGTAPEKAEKVFIVLGLLLLIVIPFFVNSYWQSVASLFVINSVILLGYRVITSMGGWSFAHVAIVGIGAYTTAILATGSVATGALDLPFWITVPVATVLAGLVALALAIPVLRTENFYFFLATFAAAEAIRQAFIQFSTLTNGNAGVSFIPRPEGFGLFDFTNERQYYYLLLVLLAVIFLLLRAFERSYTAQIIRAVAANPEVSKSIGINTWKYRSIAFVLGSAIAGLAGAFLSSYNGAINPSDYAADVMFKIVAAAVVGGTLFMTGPILGLIFLTAIGEAFRNSPEWVPLIWGVAVILSLLKMKGGLEKVYLLFGGEKHGAGRS